eukprot:8941227-Prorocentrum_lima.AAC.1
MEHPSPSNDRDDLFIAKELVHAISQSQLYRSLTACWPKHSDQLQVPYLNFSGFTWLVPDPKS